MERNINNTHIIDEIEIVTKRISQMMGREIEMSESINFINTEENTVFYFDKDLKRKYAGDIDVYYSWVDTGYCYKGEPVFISLIKYSDCFFGHFVGTGTFIVNGFCTRNCRNEKQYRKNLREFMNSYPNEIQKRMNKHIDGNIEWSDAQKSVELDKSKELTSVTKEIYDHLLFPSWKSIHGLDRYIKIIGKRIEQLIENNQTEYYVKNNINSVVVNSGLMDQFGKDYLICYRLHIKDNIMVAYKIMESKQDFIENGFSKEQASVEIRPIQFGGRDEFRFCPTMDDFDIKHSSLIHIVEERIKRFPENLREEDTSKIASILLTALERGIRMQMRDKSYAKASYCGRTGEISWLMPLHINAKLTEEPELVIVIVKRNDFYEIKTVLPYDDGMKDRITALSLYSNLW